MIYSFLRENKRLICAYLLIAFLVSVTFGGASISYARTQSSLDDEAVLGYDIGSVGSFLMDSRSYLGTSISPSYMLAVTSIMAYANDWGLIDANQESFGLLRIGFFRVISIIWALSYLLMPFLGAQFETINSKYIGPIAIISFSIGDALMKNNYIGLNIINPNSALSPVILAGAISAILMYFKLIIYLIIYGFVRLMSQAITWLALLFVQINPVFTFVTKIVRALIATGFLSLAKYAPVLYVIITIQLIGVSVYFSGWAFRVIRYFKEIYVKPVINRLFGKKVSVIYKESFFDKIPNSAKGQPLSIPAYSLLNTIGNIKTHKRERWFLTSDGNSARLYSCDLLGQNEIGLDISGVNIYLAFGGLFNRGYIEIYSLKNENDKHSNANKSMRLVFSREYKEYINEIIGMTGFTYYKADSVNLFSRSKASTVD